ncbi:hypothetical protein [Paenibacillus radicis (ex Gao et al. 2016)]|uniref:Uncharacterized protein n=1 Tax=Paenibacillus radicis (ex Gao et al. 2016) TaxID=1737354 RepID=A0A917H0E7_9BACL|nr:hypothetical protein [Paenibacillus radicis (ex Gao et al. 2016)]GGG63897.1 hypothetical protein GCM10010918_17390 [Paenibacillus radicis (ex Gao et al. 2016)]
MMQSICFAEYKIEEHSRAEFLAYTEQLLKEQKHVHLYEGTDQINLFVEIWYADNEAEAEQIKKERCSERSPWYRVSEWIIGGAGKMHVWSFKPAGTQSS